MKLFKFLFIVVSLLIFVQHGYGQAGGVESRGVVWLFDNNESILTFAKSQIQSGTAPNNYTAYYVLTPSSADSLVSKTIRSHGTGEVDVDMSVESVSGTLSGELFLGTQVGKGIIGADAEGFIWTSLGTVSGSTVSISYAHLSTSSNRYLYYPAIKVKYVETGSQETKIVIWVKYARR